MARRLRIFFIKHIPHDAVTGLRPPINSRLDVPQLPALPLNFAQSLERFDQVTTTTDFRKVITTTSYLASGDDNDKDRYFDSEWAENAIRQFLLLFEHEDQPLRSKCHENWYSVNIWSPIIDGSFLSNPGVILVRGEFTCQSSILRRNRRRSEPSLRMRSGLRHNGILCS